VPACTVDYSHNHSTIAVLPKLLDCPALPANFLASGYVDQAWKEEHVAGLVSISGMCTCPCIDMPSQPAVPLCCGTDVVMHATQPAAPSLCQAAQP
jgi:hypothetical protein